MIPTVDIDPRELLRFERALGELVSKSGLSTSVVVRKVFLDVMRDVMRGTPVDTGRARAAWSVAFDGLGVKSPAIGARGRDEAGRFLSGEAGAAPGAAEGKRLGVYEGNLPKKSSDGLRPAPSDDKPYAQITNNVRYILPLEFGSSRQAPQGMVRRTIRRHAKEFLAELGGAK